MALTKTYTKNEQKHVEHVAQYPYWFWFTGSRVNVTRVSFVKKKIVSAYYLVNYLLQSFHISHADWIWWGHDLY